MKTVELQGFKEAARLLRELPGAVSRKVLLDAQRRSLAPVLQDMRNISKLRTTSRTGRYQRSFQYKSLRGSSFTVASLVGNMYGSKGAPHAHLVEDGTKDRMLKRARIVTFRTRDGREITAKVLSTGKMPAFNVVGESVAFNKEQVMSSFETQVLRSLERMMKRYAKKYGAK